MTFLSAFVLLLLAHALGDFVFQTDRMARRKDHDDVLAWHCVIHAFLATAVTLPSDVGWATSVFTLVFLGHFAIDFGKEEYKRYATRHNSSMLLMKERDGRVGAFLGDQAAHGAHLALVAVFLTRRGVAANETFASGWTMWMSLPEGAFVRGALLVAGLILALRAGGFATGLLLRPYASQLPDASDGLTRGGAVIGYLERVLIFVLVATGQVSAVGFLIAAKSVLRFQEAKDRARAEYVIIGTLMSFAWAIAVASLVRWTWARLP